MIARLKKNESKLVLYLWLTSFVSLVAYLSAVPPTDDTGNLRPGSLVVVSLWLFVFFLFGFRNLVGFIHRVALGDKNAGLKKWLVSGVFAFVSTELLLLSSVGLLNYFTAGITASFTVIMLWYLAKRLQSPAKKR